LRIPVELSYIIIYQQGGLIKGESAAGCLSWKIVSGCREPSFHSRQLLQLNSSYGIYLNDIITQQFAAQVKTLGKISQAM
jgi:hypothetical protein